MIVPQKYGNPKKPTVIYSWEQVLEIRAISHLRQKISLQTVRKIIHFLHQSRFKHCFHDLHLVVVNDEVFWVMEDWSDMPQVMTVADQNNQHKGQFVLIIIPQLASIILEIWEEAKQSSIIDFDTFKQRAKAKPIHEIA